MDNDKRYSMIGMSTPAQALMLQSSTKLPVSGNPVLALLSSANLFSASNGSSGLIL